MNGMRELNWRESPIPGHRAGSTQHQGMRFGLCEWQTNGQDRDKSPLHCFFFPITTSRGSSEPLSYKTLGCPHRTNSPFQGKEEMAAEVKAKLPAGSRPSGTPSSGAEPAQTEPGQSCTPGFEAQEGSRSS